MSACCSSLNPGLDRFYPVLRRAEDRSRRQQNQVDSAAPVARNTWPAPSVSEAHISLFSVYGASQRHAPGVHVTQLAPQADFRNRMHGSPVTNRVCAMRSCCHKYLRSCYSADFFTSCLAFRSGALTHVCRFDFHVRNDTVRTHLNRRVAPAVRKCHQLDAHKCLRNAVLRAEYAD